MGSDGTDGGRTDGDRVLVLNPVSGDETRVDDVVELARDHGFEVRRTERSGDGKRLAHEAAVDAGLVAAAGGDGTIHEVVNGVFDADALGSTTVAVVPTGTGNNFATNVGIEGIEHAFEAIDRGRRRIIDLGIANDLAFVNSCVGGLTAEASDETSSESKRNLGVLAYVKTTLQTARSFDSLPLRVESAVGPDGERGRTWDGEALFVLVGNCRRFNGTRTAQANVEDGLFELTIVEAASAPELLGDAAFERLFGRDGKHIVRLRTPSLSIESGGEPVGYSLDGEILETERLVLETNPGALEVVVTESYRADPDADGTPWPLGRQLERKASNGVRSTRSKDDTGFTSRDN
ncbi:diacylglycerol kinase family lipid kinase [Natrarchaeobius halalkaliphilus]|uniref:Diacylglycerol kinase family lipid kinase n=1 Tax=Natrarchaeobius halalkaliphilus TaxID=1679091 RepID=A0A3N6M0T3_9EURY|nr:diacylglycerol kinase family protein [Natrarchaeobius halalkaliphilus]RQG89260.1 diacylglycerol kinase family lipid kinase [Natrarchaeobius halalkaliphilus]